MVFEQGFKSSDLSRLIEFVDHLAVFEVFLMGVLAEL